MASIAEEVLRRLDYYEVIAMLAGQCTSSLGRSLAQELVPVTDKETVEAWLEETSEAERVLRFHPSIPLGGIGQVHPILTGLGIGRSLDPEELLVLKDTLRAGRLMKHFIHRLEGDYPRLQALAAELADLKSLEDEVNRCLSPEGEVLDSASSNLERLRRSIRINAQRVKDKMDSLIRSSQFQKYLQDNIITQRQDRYVIPVKQEYRPQVPGIVHDQSASGATLFIEPMAVVELNNELRRLRAEEGREIQLILRQLTQAFYSRLPEVEATIGSLARLDFALAKGKLSHQLDGVRPRINDRGYVRLVGARHPLLGSRAVPISLELGEEFLTLVITGPNTGGKTVALKTVGLMTLMAQSGLHLPAEERTEVTVFSQVFADIGDEQSIQQSLSTFSSHLSQIIQLIPLVNHHSLVLLDELGAGTDPTEGSALARAILEYIHQREARTVATTHYSELKAFAYSHPGIQNAAVEFDVETLRPTYRVLMGVPGQSNAFAIAARLGLSPEIIDRAKSHLTLEQKQVSELIRELEENRSGAEAARWQAELMQKETGDVLARLRDQEEELRRERREFRENASRELRKRLRQFKEEAENILAQLLEEVDDEKHRLRDKLAARSNQRFKVLAQEMGLPELIPPRGVPPSRLAEGDRVLINSLQQKGAVVSAPPDKDEVLVQVGPMRVTVKKEDLSLVDSGASREAEEPETGGRGGMGAFLMDKAQNIKSSIDLRGMTVEEAQAALEKYLDDASLAGLKTVTIIHGKGTGALRKGIVEWLGNHPQIKSRRPGGEHEGGLGVAVVELK